MFEDNSKSVIFSSFNAFLFLTEDYAFEAFGFHFNNVTIGDFSGSMLEFSYDRETENMMWDVFYINTLYTWWKNRNA